MENGDLFQFEKFIMKKEKFNFDFSYEIVMFVKKINEYIVKYYYCCVYSYIFKNRYQDNKIINNNDLSNNEYISYLFNNLLEFVSIMNFENYKYETIINMARDGRVPQVINYYDCVNASRELNELQLHNICKLIFEIEKNMVDPNYSFLKELDDFSTRLLNHYKRSNSKKLERIKEFKELVELAN